MGLTLHPRAAPADRLRLWLGAFGRTAAPQVAWELDGRQVDPTVLRPLAPARPDDLVAEPAEPRAFTGVFELTGPGVSPGSVHTVVVRTGDGESARRTVRTLPERLPAGLDQRFNVLLVSCFHRLEDKRGLAGDVVAHLPAAYRPHLTVLMGDQVYLDLPTLRNFPDDAARLARKFEREDYTENWSGSRGYSRILGLAPSVSLPDDHEYWNNFPHRSPFLQNTHRGDGRRRWQRAARALYEAFQLPQPEGFERALEVDVAPLSFYFLDTRSARAEDRSASATRAVREQLADWVDRVIAAGKTALVTTGQPLLAERKGRIEGSVADFSLPNYGDYEEIVGHLARIPEAGLPLVLLTGDVHWGRVLAARDIGRSGRELIHEVICSPSSLVTTVGSDQLATLGAAFRGVFGRRPAWARHSDPAPVPAHIVKQQLGSRYESRPVHAQKGNQVATLSFRASGSGSEVEVRYWPIREPAASPRPVLAGTLPLTPA